MLRSILVGAFLALMPLTAAFGQQASTPTDAVDAFHRALRVGDTAGALSLLARDLVVYEFGVADPTVEAYTFQHLPLDMDMAAATTWALENRQTGGTGDARWVLSIYRVTGADVQGDVINHLVMETAIVVRSGEQFRIAHLHWSTDDPAYQAEAQGLRLEVQAEGAQ